MTKSASRIMIVDDHALFLESIAMVLEGDDQFSVVAQASSGEEAIRLLDEVETDVCILDVSMPGMGGFETLRDLKDRYPELGILVLSMHDEANFGSRCIKAGADGYLTKGCSSSDLIKALGLVSSGEMSVSPQLAGILANEARSGKADQPLHAFFSDRELEIFLRFAQGEAINGIASDLALSPKTITSYRTRIVDKLGVQTNVDLAMYALRFNLISREMILED